jgi:hypothetical protein
MLSKKSSLLLLEAALEQFEWAGSEVASGFRRADWRRLT